MTKYSRVILLLIYKSLVYIMKKSTKRAGVVWRGERRKKVLLLGWVVFLLRALDAGVDSWQLASDSADRVFWCERANKFRETLKDG